MRGLLPPVDARHRVLLGPMLGSFVLFGLCVTLIAAVLPKVIREFHWSYTTTGLVLSAGSVGYFISTFCCGIWIRRLGPKAVIVSGLLVQAVGLATFGAGPSALLGALLQLLIGFGNGGTEVVVNYSVVRMEPSGQGRLMNLTHAAFAVGAIASPLAVRSLAAFGVTWQTMFRLVAAASLAMAVTLALLPLGRLHPADEDRAEPLPVGFLLRQPLLVLCFLILLVYVGAEIGVSAWVAEYAVTVLKTSAGAGALMVSTFWVGLLVGRLGISACYHGTRLGELLVVLSGVCTVALAAALLARSPVTAAVGFFAAGLGYSAIYPVVMALVGRHYPGGQSVAVGIAGAGGGVGAFVFPFIMAALADATGIGWGFWFYVALNVVLLALTAAALAVIRR